MDIQSILNPLEKDSRDLRYASAATGTNTQKHSVYPARVGASLGRVFQDFQCSPKPQHNRSLSSPLKGKHSDIEHAMWEAKRSPGQTKVQNGMCRAHTLPPMVKRPFDPAHDAFVLFVQDRIGQYLNSSLMVGLKRGGFSIRHRRDNLYRYQPEVSCLACDIISQLLKKMDWE